MYLVNESSKHEPVKRVYKTREKSQSLLDHPRMPVLFTFYLKYTRFSGDEHCNTSFSSCNVQHSLSLTL